MKKNIDEMMEMLALLYENTNVKEAKLCYDQLVHILAKEYPRNERVRCYIKWENMKNGFD